MKAIRATIGRLTMGCVLAFGLTSNLHAQPVPPEDTNNYPPPTQEELEAAYQAWLAQLATNRESILPYLHEAQTLPDGSPWMVDAAASYQQEQLILLAEENQTAYDSAQIQVTNWSTTTGEPVVSAGPDERTITLIGF